MDVSGSSLFQPLCKYTNGVYRGGVINLKTVHAVKQSLLHQRTVYMVDTIYHAIIIILHACCFS